jgi:hypothetical protein
MAPERKLKKSVGAFLYFLMHCFNISLWYRTSYKPTTLVLRFPFKQGTNTSVPFFNMVGGFLSEPSKEQKECQHPKPILLNTGRARFPYSWDPNSVPISVFRVGSFFILNVPAGKLISANIDN